MVDLDADVLVIGGGNAGLCAAISARLAGADVLVLERAPVEQRGGNSALTKNIRFPYDTWEQLAALIDVPTAKDFELLSSLCREPYTEERMLSDWLDGRGQSTQVELVKSIIYSARDTISWLRHLGHRWSTLHNPLPGALQLQIDGGGRGLQARAFAAAYRMAVRFRYSSTVIALDRGSTGEWQVRTNDATVVRASCIVIASGGFQANSEMVSTHLGAHWSGVKLRGVPFNDGTGINLALANGAEPAGNWAGCHAVPYATRMGTHCMPSQISSAHKATRYAYPLGMIVDESGRRFLDEGMAYGNLTYASVGAAILSRPNRRAWQVFGSFAIARLGDNYALDPASVSSNSVDGLAAQLGLPRSALGEEIDRLNFWLRAAGEPPAVPRTRNIPPLSPPFFAIPIECGLTFTFGGLQVDKAGAVCNRHGSPIPGLYACGEAVGGLYDTNYPGGVGLLAGATLGRRAGAFAARHIHNE